MLGDRGSKAREAVRHGWPAFLGAILGSGVLAALVPLLPMYAENPTLNPFLAWCTYKPYRLIIVAEVITAGLFGNACKFQRTDFRKRRADAIRHLGYCRCV